MRAARGCVPGRSGADAGFSTGELRAGWENKSSRAMRHVTTGTHATQKKISKAAQGRRLAQEAESP